jgi:hypothetical protein
MASEDLITIAEDYVHHLVLGDYGYRNGLAMLDDSLSLDPDDIGQFLVEYGGTLVDPPEAAFVLGFRLAHSVNYRRVAVTLWTAEEGETNIRLNLDITLAPPYQVVVTDIGGCPPRLIPALQEVIHHLVIDDFSGLQEHDHLRRYNLTGTIVQSIIMGYLDRAWENNTPHTMDRLNCTLVDMPAHAFKSAFAVHTLETPGSWTVEFRLWWKDNCIKGDLTLRTEIEETAAGIDVQVVGIEVM